MEFLHPLKKKNSLFEITLGVFLCLLVCLGVSQFIVKNQFLMLIPVGVFFLISIWLFTSRQHAAQLLSEIQLLFLFFPLIFLYVTGIPKIAPLPLSPVFLFLGIYIFLTLGNLRNAFRVLQQPAGNIFFLLLVCWFYQYFVAVVVAGGSLLNMQFFEFIGFYFGMRFFTRNRIHRAIWATRVLACVLVISMAYFIGEVLVKDSFFTELRFFLYQAIFQKYIGVYPVDLPGGLSPFLFMFAYQVAVAVPLCILLFFIEPKKSWRIFWGIGSLCALLAMFFAGERSVLGAVGFTFCLFLYKSKRFKAAFAIGVLVAASLAIFSQTVVEVNLFTKLQKEASQAEGLERIKLQLIGLEVILTNPLGLMTSGETWGEEADSAGADFSAWSGREIGVHNGYLTRIIGYGWIFGAIMGMVLFRLLKEIKIIVSLEQKNLEGIEYAATVAWSLLAVLIQAMFHHPSLFTFNTTSVSITCLFLTWFDLLVVHYPETFDYLQGRSKHAVDFSHHVRV